MLPGRREQLQPEAGRVPLYAVYQRDLGGRGKRVDRAFKMMWERECIEEAQKTYMGNRTNEAAKWQ